MTTNTLYKHLSHLGEKLFMVSAVAVTCSLLCSCQGMYQSQSRSPDVVKKKELPPLIQADKSKGIEERLSIQAYDPLLETPKESAAVAAVLMPLASSALKWANGQLWSALDNYADQFGRSYGKSLSSSNYGRLGEGAPILYPFVFRRTMIFEDEKTAKTIQGAQVLAKVVDGKKKYEVVVVEVPFALITSGSHHHSWRFVSLTSPALSKFTGRLKDMRYPLHATYRARAAKALPLRSIDKFEVVVTATARSSDRSELGVMTVTSDPVFKKLTLANIKSTPFALGLEGDWFPTPFGRGYSVTLNIVETSKLKAWIKKLASKGKEMSDALIDESFES